MRFDWVSLVKTQLPDGVFQQKTELSRVSCWADKQSVTYGEFYAADADGRKVDAVFDVSPIDYDEQEKLIHHTDDGDVEYSIVRAFDGKQPNTVLLTCTRIGE